MPRLRPGDQAWDGARGGVAGRDSWPDRPPALAQCLLAAASAAATSGQIPLTQASGRSGVLVRAVVDQGETVEIRANTVLPARRENVVLHTADGFDLVGELALPRYSVPVATLIALHPLPTEGGMMDSHVLRKASYRLPALADLAVLRFNTRGTASERGRSEGEFGSGEAERHDVAAAIAWATTAGLPRLWLLGWSFGTELAIKWGLDPAVEGAILLSPPLKRA